MSEINFPFGAADLQTETNPTGTTAITVSNSKTIVVLDEPSGAVSLDITADDELPIGAELIIDCPQSATGRDVTFNSGAVGAGITGVANDRDVVTLVYNGTTFLQTRVEKIVDAA